VEQITNRTSKEMDTPLLNYESVITYPELAILILCIFWVLVFGSTMTQQKRSDF